MEVKILTNICRICLNDNELVSIFNSQPDIQICDKIMACAAVHVADGDPLPTQICIQCQRALDIAYLFKTKCEQMDRQLRKVIQDQIVLLNQTCDVASPIKYSAVQICIQPSSTPIFSNLDSYPLQLSTDTEDQKQITVNIASEMVTQLTNLHDDTEFPSNKSKEDKIDVGVKINDSEDPIDTSNYNEDTVVQKEPLMQIADCVNSHSDAKNEFISEVQPLSHTALSTGVEHDTKKMDSEDQSHQNNEKCFNQPVQAEFKEREVISIIDNCYGDDSTHDLEMPHPGIFSNDDTTEAIHVDLDNFNMLKTIGAHTKPININDILNCNTQSEPSDSVTDTTLDCDQMVNKTIEDPLSMPVIACRNEDLDDMLDIQSENRESSNSIVQHPNGDIVMYFDNDEIHLGEECEVITDEICPPEKTCGLDLVSQGPSMTTHDEPYLPNVTSSLPKGRYVVIKSVIKPQNIHYVTVDNFRKKNTEDSKKLVPIKQVESSIKKELTDSSHIKSEVPEPAAYIETETSASNINLTSRSANNESILDNNHEDLLLNNSSMASVIISDEEANRPSVASKSISSVMVENKPRGRGRPKKSDKYKPPQGVSYLKSGRKTVPVFVRSRKLKRSRYSVIKTNFADGTLSERDLSNNILTKCTPIIKRARVEKIIPYRIPDEKKTEYPNRGLSTTLLSSDKHLRKLNNPQKQVLYQRLKLQNFRPTSKKDITERGIPEPLFVVSPTLSDDELPTKHTAVKKIKGKRFGKINSISDDLAIIRSSNKKLKHKHSNRKLQTIDQDLKLINSDVTGKSIIGSPKKENGATPMDSNVKTPDKTVNVKSTGENSETVVKTETTPVAKTGRHTAIKSKRPQKRNRLLSDSYSDPQKIEIELKIVPRKSVRQRSPKKIFPEIDLFSSPKRKIIEIPVSEGSSVKGDDKTDYEIEQNVSNHSKFKIKLKSRSSLLNSPKGDNSENTPPVYLKSENDIDGNYYNEIEVETENDDEKHSDNDGYAEGYSGSDIIGGNCSSDGGSSSKNYHNSNAAIVQRILDKERVKLDYGAGLSCNVCNKSFPYRSHLIRHVRTHTGLKPYTCEYCKKNFTSLSSLNIHVKNHVGDHPYACEVCGRGFVQPSVLKRHMLSHTGEHPYQCEICYKTFVHDSSLKTHLKMHTVKEPQNKCEICEKKFKYLSTLTSHMKTHSGIKPFTCPECRKAFYRRSLLTRHMRSHTNERPYKCKLCKARFAYSGGLASHRKLHTGIRPYECELCEFTFFRMSHLKNHVLKIHNNGILLECQKCNMQFDSKPLFKEHVSLHIKREPIIDYNEEL